MRFRGLTLFESPVGAIGLAFTETAIAAVQLPEVDDEATVARIRVILSARYGSERFELGAPLPTHALAAVRSIEEHLSSGAADLTGIALDEIGLSKFRLRVFELARAIPSGQARTYGELARGLSSPGAARAIGRAMATNPFPIVVPCHRVVGTKGPSKDAAFRPGGFSAYGGLATKARLLEIERAPLAKAMAAAARDAASATQGLLGLSVREA